MNTPVTLPERATWSDTTLADLGALAKPRITLMVLATTLGGLYMAPNKVDRATMFAVLAGTTLVVSGANALNMYLERDVDRRMARTRLRPLPAGRMAPGVALAFGLATTLAALPVLAFGANLATALLAATANASYVLLYTPLKQRSWFAVVVGAFPGAMPPLLGWAAATGGVGSGGLALFAILFFWQVPHFHAIALFRSEEYARAGLKVLPHSVGPRLTAWHIAVWTALVVAASLAPLALGMVSWWYAIAAGLLDAVFFGWALMGLRAGAGARWARRYFVLSMPYLVLVFVALLLAHRG